jgi:hypothetical protein
MTLSRISIGMLICQPVACMDEDMGGYGVPFPSSRYPSIVKAVKGSNAEVV